MSSQFRAALFPTEMTEDRSLVHEQEPFSYNTSPGITSQCVDNYLEFYYERRYNQWTIDKSLIMVDNSTTIDTIYDIKRIDNAVSYHLNMLDARRFSCGDRVPLNLKYYICGDPTLVRLAAMVYMCNASVELIQVLDHAYKDKLLLTYGPIGTLYIMKQKLYNRPLVDLYSIKAISNPLFTFLKLP